MIVVGSIVNDAEQLKVDQHEALADFIMEEFGDQGVTNKALAAIDQKLIKFSVDEINDSPNKFILTVNEPEKRSCEYLFVEEYDIDEVFEDYVEETQDEDAWREAVSNYDTEDGFYEWQQGIISEREYADYMTVDGIMREHKGFYVLKTG